MNFDIDYLHVYGSPGTEGQGQRSNSETQSVGPRSSTEDIFPAASVFCTLCSREAEYAEASTGEVTEELDEMRRSFSARLRSESLQRQSDNLEKDSRIEQLENILRLQLQREKRKDRKIAELEERVDAIAPSTESRCGEMPEEGTSSVSRDDGEMVVESQMVRGGTRGNETEDRIHSDRPCAATSKVLSWEGGDEPTCSGTQVKDERLKKNNRETSPEQEERRSIRQTIRRIKIPFLSKLL